MRIFQEIASWRPGRSHTNALSVSVVINTLNRAHTLAGTLQGLEQQDASNFEVIVVNGPSTDGTDALLEQYASRIRIGRCPEPSLGMSRNIGVDMAAGDIVAFTDDDAIPRKGWLSQLRRGYTDETIGAVGGYVWDAVNSCMQWKACTCTFDGTVLVDTPPPHRRYQGRGVSPYLYLPGCNMSVRRSCVSSVGGFNENLSYVYEDAELYGRLHHFGYRIVALPNALVDHLYDVNHARDDQRVIRDPYLIVRGFSVFVLQNIGRAYSTAPAEAAAQAHANEWRDGGRSKLASGNFTSDEFDSYLQRIDEGLYDGLATGALPRPVRSFAPVMTAAFRPFK